MMIDLSLLFSAAESGLSLIALIMVIRVERKLHDRMSKLETTLSVQGCFNFSDCPRKERQP